MRTVLVGQAPSSETDVPFAGRSGARLAAVAGVSLAELRRRLRPVNLLPRFPGHSRGKGDRFPELPAWRAARRLARDLDGARVVAAGKGVARAFGVARPTWFIPVVVELSGSRFELLTIPHPSGVNLWWNDPENVSRAGCELRRLVKEASDG